MWINRLAEAISVSLQTSRPEMVHAQVSVI